MVKIIIETIPHKTQRYETCGDWQEFDTGFHITVSEMNNSSFELLVGLHELIEAVLCKQRGITQESVDKFDTQFEALRFAGDTSEPGDHSLAPYRKEHFFATSIERLVASELGVDWAKYEAVVNEL